MSVKEQLTEPWGLVAAGILGGLGAAVAGALAPGGLVTGILVGLAIAVVVLVIRVGLGTLFSGTPAREELPAAARGGAADHWVRRATTAVDTLRRQPVVEIGDQAGAALLDLTRFAGQIAIIEQTSAGIDPGRLIHDREQLKRMLVGVPAGPLRDERERALKAVTDQLDVSRRLHEARELLLARMQSTVHGLEGLGARAAELRALQATAGGSSLAAMKVAELTSDLEGMRAGLAEAERLSQSALADGQAN